MPFASVEKLGTSLVLISDIFPFGRNVNRPCYNCLPVSTLPEFFFRIYPCRIFSAVHCWKDLMHGQPISDYPIASWKDLDPGSDLAILKPTFFSLVNLLECLGSCHIHSFSQSFNVFAGCSCHGAALTGVQQ